MVFNERSKLEIGDWVKGKSKDGELILGYIVSCDNLKETTKIKIIECDNEAIIGKTIKLLTRNIEKLPISTSMIEEQILNLIDLALLTKDRPWFTELSIKLNEIRQMKIDKEKDLRGNETLKEQVKLGTRKL